MATFVRNPGSYALIQVLADADMGGDTFLPIDEAMRRCARKNNRATEHDLTADLEELLHKGWVVEENGNLYNRANWRYENAAAEKLAAILQNHNELPAAPNFEAALAAAEAMLPLPLDADQKKAVQICLSHRISIVTGGAGAGKTTMVRALHLTNSILTSKSQTLLCAPTGKAARNLSQKAGHPACTVHRALGKVPDSDFLDTSGCIWSQTNLVIVDEASMVTLEMLAGLLGQVGSQCRIVLVGDPNQLPAVGAGNVLHDLLQLGFSHIHLSGNHRQDHEAGALLHNVQEFRGPDSVTLEFDDSFRLVEAYSADKAKAIVQDLYGPMIMAGEEVQVLSPFRESSAAAAGALNQAIQKSVNPPAEDKLELSIGKRLIRNGDRVILTENLKRYCNGDIGTVTIQERSPTFQVDFGYQTGTFEKSVGSRFELAYAITIHKAQGSEYDTVIVPILRDFGVMLNRHLLYTAISRARKQVVLVGNADALEKALYTNAPSRKTTLVERVRTNLQKAV